MKAWVLTHQKIRLSLYKLENRWKEWLRASKANFCLWYLPTRGLGPTISKEKDNKAGVGVEEAMFFLLVTLSLQWVTFSIWKFTYLFSNSQYGTKDEPGIIWLQETYTHLYFAITEFYWKDIRESQGNKAFAGYLDSRWSKVTRQPSWIFPSITTTFLCFSLHVCLLLDMYSGKDSFVLILLLA